MPDDPEPRRRAVLTEQRDPVDRKPCETDGGKAFPQHREHRLAPLAGKASGQCHVEAKLFHHIRVAPAVEIIALPRRQFRRLAPRAVFRR